MSGRLDRIHFKALRREGNIRCADPHAKIDRNLTRTFTAHAHAGSLEHEHGLAHAIPLGM